VRLFYTVAEIEDSCHSSFFKEDVVPDFPFIASAYNESLLLLKKDFVNLPSSFIIDIFMKFLTKGEG
jgi:hypothetical protein